MFKFVSNQYESVKPTVHPKKNSSNTHKRKYFTTSRTLLRNLTLPDSLLSYLDNGQPLNGRHISPLNKSQQLAYPISLCDLTFPQNIYMKIEGSFDPFSFYLFVLFISLCLVNLLLNVSSLL